MLLFKLGAKWIFLTVHFYMTYFKHYTWVFKTSATVKLKNCKHELGIAFSCTCANKHINKALLWTFFPYIPLHTIQNSKVSVSSQHNHVVYCTHAHTQGWMDISNVSVVITLPWYIFTTLQILFIFFFPNNIKITVSTHYCNILSHVYAFTKKNVFTFGSSHKECGILTTTM